MAKKLLVLFGIGLTVAILARGAFFSTSDSEPGLIAEERPTSYFFDQRAFPRAKLDRAAFLACCRTVDQMKSQLLLTDAPEWRQVGPFNIQGRITGLAVDPTDENTVYAAAADGGIFRTFDGGNNWQATFDDMPTLSMGAVAIDPSAPNVVYAGTGEVNPGRGSLTYGGEGLFRSDDQGDSWTALGLQDTGSIGRVVVHPTESNIIHVAAMGHIWQSGPDRGVYRTTDGGASWSKVLFIDDVTGCVDIIQRPDDPNILFAAMWRRFRAPENFEYGGSTCGIYRSEDGGLTWSLEANGLPAQSENTGRIGLSICQTQPDVICAVYGQHPDGFLDAIYRTTDGGANWSPINIAPIADSFGTAQAWYGNVRINPQDPDQIFVLGLFLHSTPDAGQSYFDFTSLHVDHHAFAFGPGPAPKMYSGNDGGVYSSLDGFNWTKTSGDFPITQIYRVSTAAWNNDAVWIGTQDNGSNQDLEGDGDFSRVFGGDGFQVVPHLVETTWMWAQFQYGNVFFSQDSGQGFTDARDGLFGRVNWNAPHAQDPNDPNRRYFGTDRVFRNLNPVQWEPISDDLTGGVHQGVLGQVNGTLTTITVSPADSNVIWSGSDDGVVHVTQDGGANWTDVSSPLPERWVTSLFAHPVNPGEAWVTFSGFRWGEDISHVYRTADFGENWSPAGGDLPDIPVNDIFVDPENLSNYYVATDVNVFQSVNAGQNWSVFGKGLPNVVVNDFAYRSETRELVAGTYGRSVFAIDLDPLLIGDINCDGVIDLLDVDPFVNLLVSGEFLDKADLNSDGFVTLLDVPLFVDLLTQ